LVLEIDDSLLDEFCENILRSDGLPYLWLLGDDRLHQFHKTLDEIGNRPRFLVLFVLALGEKEQNVVQ
jgi:hypothetical protein